MRTPVDSLLVPALASAMGWLILGEGLAPLGLVGAGLIGAAVLLIAVRERFAGWPPRLAS